MDYRLSIYDVYSKNPEAFKESARRHIRRVFSIWTVLQILFFYAILGGALYLSGDAPLSYYVIVGFVCLVAIPIFNVSRGIRKDLDATARERSFDSDDY
jgi:hypothetical protein